MSKAYDGVLEVRTVYSDRDVNRLLKTGNWKLLDTFTERIKATEYKTKTSEFDLFDIIPLGTLSENQPVKVEKERVAYVMGRIK